MAEVEETIVRLKNMNHVGLLIIDRNQKIIRSNFTNANAAKGEILRNNVPLLTRKAERIIQDVDPENSLVFLRVKVKGCELMVAPNKEFFLTAVQYEDKTKSDDQK